MGISVEDPVLLVQESELRWDLFELVLIWIVAPLLLWLLGAFVRLLVAILINFAVANATRPTTTTPHIAEPTISPLLLNSHDFYYDRQFPQAARFTLMLPWLASGLGSPRGFTRCNNTLHSQAETGSLSNERVKTR